MATTATDPRAATPAQVHEPGPNPIEAAVRPVTMPFIDRFASALVTGVPPVILVIGMILGWSSHLLVWQDLVVLAVMYCGIGMGITVGFHRLLTHRSFKTNRWVRAGFAALGSAAAEAR